MEPDEARHLFVVADEAYRVPLAVVLRSILESQPHGSLPLVHIFTLGMGVDSRERVERSVPGMNIEWHGLEPSLPAESLRAGTVLPAAAWGRVFAADLLAGRARRALYLDLDMLVVDDLSPLWATDLAGRPVAAVTAPGNPQVSCPAAGLGTVWRRLGLDPRTPYLQSGLLLIDIEAWKARSISRGVVEACSRFGETFKAADQDAINCVLGGDFMPLPLRWNQTSMLRGPSSWAYSFFPVEEVDEALGRPAVIHFSGLAKPWDAGPGDSPEYGRWWDVLSRTDFADRRPPWFRAAIRRVRAMLAAKLRP